MKPYLFLDLDDTIFQTKRKCPPDVDLKVAASGRDGSPLSFMTYSQFNLFNLFSETMRVIPTTARSFDAFSRVHLPFANGAILDYGGVILGSDGALDEEWDSRIRENVRIYRDDTYRIMESIKEYAASRSLLVTVRIIGDYGMDFYVVIKNLDANISQLEELHRDCIVPLAPEGYYVHFNDNNIAVIPRFLNKANAVQFLIEHRLRSADDSLMTLGMGDSLSDLRYMGICDYLITPSTSQITKTLL